MKIYSLPIVFFSLAISLPVMAQPSFAGLENLFTVPRHYVVCHTTEKPVIDGNISDVVWNNAAWSEPFVDIEGDLKPVPRFKTRIKMLWNDTCLFVAAELEEPNAWAYMQQHDEPLYLENNFEVFFDPGNTTHQYFEIEVNARNTVFDVFLSKPYRNGAKELMSWDAPGLVTAVNIQGSLNNPVVPGKSWTVEMAIPFAALSLGAKPEIPTDGRIWRFNSSRVEWQTDVIDGKHEKKKDAVGKTLAENNWVWSPQGIVSMHCPERWGYLQFSKQIQPTDVPPFVLPYSEMQRQYLWLVYYRQKDYYEKNKKYAPSLSKLGIKPAAFEIAGKKNVLTMDVTESQFTAVIQSAENRISINDEGLVQEN